MKRSVIKDIFSGGKIPLTETNKENLKELAEGYDRLRNRFNAKQMKLIDKFLSVYDKNYCDEVDLYFTEGFKLGLLIVVERFVDNE